MPYRLFTAIVILACLVFASCANDAAPPLTSTTAALTAEESPSTAPARRLAADEVGPPPIELTADFYPGIEAYVRLSWRDPIFGDYNRDGVTTGFDVFPLAVHFGEHSDYNGNTAEEPNNNCIDGNQDGSINGLDLFQIATNFNNRISSYSVFRAAAETGPFDTELNTSPIPQAVDADCPPSYEWDDDAPIDGFNWYVVRSWSSVHETWSGDSEVVSVEAILGPAITDISPAEGIAGTEVAITGQSFIETQGSGTVTFGGAEAEIIGWTDSLITCIVPAGADDGVVVTDDLGRPSDVGAFDAYRALVLSVFGHQMVELIDLRDYSIIGDGVDLPAGAADVALTPDGKLAVLGNTGAGGTGATASVIDVGNWSLVTDGIPTGQGPWGVEIDSTGENAYLSNNKGAGFTHIELNGFNSLVIENDDLYRSASLAYAPLSNLLLFPCKRNPEGFNEGILPYDLTAEEWRTIILTGDTEGEEPWEVAVSADETWCVTTDADFGNELSIVSLQTNEEIDEIFIEDEGVKGEPRGVCTGMTSRGERVFVTAPGLDELWVIDPFDWSVETRVACGEGSFPWRAVHLDGADLLFVSLRHTDQVLVLDTSRASYPEVDTVDFTEGAQPHGMAITP